MNKPSDELLAIKAKAGDSAAFEELYERYKKPLLNFIYRMISNRETAEEICQEVFIKVYNHLDIFDTKRSFTTWLYTIARNLAKNALRDRKYFRDISLDQVIAEDDDAVRLKDIVADTAAGPREVAESDELQKAAQNVLDSLPLKYKEVIVLCSVQGLTYKEAAAILGCSVAVVSVRFNKAKIIFMKKLGIVSDDSAGK